MTGHTDSATTVGIYGHLMPGALPKAMARVGELWEEALAPTASGEVVDISIRRKE